MLIDTIKQKACYVNFSCNYNLRKKERGIGLVSLVLKILNVMFYSCFKYLKLFFRVLKMNSL